MFKNQDLQMCVLKKKTYTSNLHQLEVVYRGSETQLEVAENSKYLI